MKKRRFLTGILCLTVAGASCMMPVSAEDGTAAFRASLHEKPADKFEIVTEEHAAFPDQVGQVTSYTLQGLAVTCADTARVTENGIGGFAVQWSDGIWSSLGIPADTCRMQPVSGFAACYGKTEEYVSGADYLTYSVDDALLRADMYLLTVSPELVQNADRGSDWSADYDALLDAVLADDAVTLCGAVYGAQTAATIYNGAGNAVVQLAEGAAIPEALRAYGAIEPYYDGFYYLNSGSTRVELSDMRKRCEAMMQIDGVTLAYPAGTVPESLAEGTVGFGVELRAFTEKTSAVQYISRVVLGDCTLLYNNAATGIWYNENGAVLTSTTAPQQTALYEGVQYTVDLDAMQVTAADGTLNEELTALLPTYLAFRPLFLYGADGVTLDEVQGTPQYDALLEKINSFVQAIPLTYRFSDSTDQFYCEVLLGDSVLGGMQYSIDANDYPEAVPWQQESAGGSFESLYTWTGDVNVSGETDLRDAVLLAKLTAQNTSETVSALGFTLGDMDADGVLTARDLTSLLRSLSGIA